MNTVEQKIGDGKIWGSKKVKLLGVTIDLTVILQIFASKPIKN